MLLRFLNISFRSKQEQLLYRERQCFDIINFTFSGFCFLSDSLKLIELIFVTTHVNLNYLIDTVKT